MLAEQAKEDNAEMDEVGLNRPFLTWTSLSRWDLGVEKNVWRVHTYKETKKRDILK